jgi:HEAT repeat protein
MGERTGGVGRERRGPGVPDDEEAEAGSGRRRGRGWGLTGLFALAISGLVLYLAWLLMWERSHPASPAARAVQAGEVAGRLRAVADLERLGPEDPDVAFPALIAALDDPNADVRAAAALALVTVIRGAGVGGSYPQQVGDTVRTLLARTKDPHAVVRTSVVQALWMTVILWQGAPPPINLDVIEAVMDEAAADPDASVRAAGIRGLGVVGRQISEDPPPKLVAALEDESEAVRGAAAQGLTTFPRGLVRLLPALVKSLESTRPERRPAYLGLLKQIGPAARPPEQVKELVAALVAALRSPDREVRHQVVELLGQCEVQAQGAIPALVAVLGQEGGVIPQEPMARGSATGPDLVVDTASALARVAGTVTKFGEARDVPGAREAVAALKPLLRSSDPRRRAAAATALRSFYPDAALVPALSEAVADRDATVRTAALWALHDYAFKLEFAAPKAIPDALEDDAPEVRVAAAAALGRIKQGVEPMIPALIRHGSRDPDREVRNMCAAALHELEPPAVTAAVVPMYIEAIDNVEAPVHLRERLIDALGRFGPTARGAVPAIIRALESSKEKDAGPDPGGRASLRERAAWALGQLAPGSPSAPDAINALTRALDDPADGVRSSAARSLVPFGPAARAAAPALIRLLGQARDRKSARAAGQLAIAVRAIAPGAPEEGQALAALLELLQIEPKLQSIDLVIDALARFGPGAAAALPRLREMTSSRDLQAGEAAQKAVIAIEGPGQ